jgi:hypothetical protein
MSAVYHDFIPLYFAGDTAVDATTASAAVLGVIAVPYKCQVRRVQCLQADNDATGGTISFIQRATAGATTDDSTTPYVDRGIFATLTLPASNQQGKMYYKDLTTNVVLLPGQEIAVKSSAGTGEERFMVLVERIPEVPANLSNMVAG